MRSAICISTRVDNVTFVFKEGAGKGADIGVVVDYENLAGLSVSDG
ncbi:MAG TPA: hypothetical protein VK593_04220 [Edaphobacter sp.]|nr:hypothetical protein [Edaphobacter sp.]